jgi:hypothetical protein
MSLKASVLMAMYSMRSERAFCERLNYDMLFKWFRVLPIDAVSFDASTFSKNHQRLLDADVADEFFAAVVHQSKLRRYISSDHSAWMATCWRRGRRSSRSSPRTIRATMATPRRASMPRSPGMTRNDRTTPMRRRPTRTLGLYRKSNNTAATLCYAGHLLIEHRSALFVEAPQRPGSMLSIDSHRVVSYAMKLGGRGVAGRFLRPQTER